MQREIDFRLHAAELMKLAAEAIARAADRVDGPAFAAASKLLEGCRGKVVTTGAGTSGVIARKIAATLTSTGTPATFLHPVDALHGALGIVDANDVAIIVSNGGESDELVGLLPYLRKRSVPYIAIVGNVESTIGRNAAVALDAYAERETCPHNLAPTSSTSVALAVGDALAITLMELKGITPEQFALNHPSGRLGRRLTLTVGDLMRAGPDKPVVTPASSWLEVVTAISGGGAGATTVEDNAGNFLGLITDGDVRRAVQKHAATGLDGLTAEQFMTRNPVTVESGALAVEALSVMEDRPSQISLLPVVEGNRCVGLLRLHDLVRAGL